MNTNTFRITLFLLILAIALGSPSWAGDKDGSYPYSSYPSINEVLTEFGELEQVTLVVSGHNFLRRWGRTPYVSLGSGRAFTLLEATDNDLVLLADLPDGDYLLRISHDKYFRDSKTAAYGLTVGMIGPEGLAGPQGDPGQPGIDGPLGLKGPPGPVGLQGLAGSQGLDGSQGDQGTQGEPGARGKDGVDGPPGNKGDQGDEGDQGVPGAVAHHEWKGKTLKFQQSDGTWGEAVNLQGQAAPGFDIQQACTLFAAIYQDYLADTGPDHLASFVEDLEAINDRCYQSCPGEFRAEVDEWLASLETDLPVVAAMGGQSIESSGKPSKVEFTIEEINIENALLEIFAAIGIPTYCQDCAKNKMLLNYEKGKLKSLYNSQIAYFGETERFAESYQELHCMPLDEEFEEFDCTGAGDWDWSVDTWGGSRVMTAVNPELPAFPKFIVESSGPKPAHADDNLCIGYYGINAPEKGIVDRCDLLQPVFDDF